MNPPLSASATTIMIISMKVSPQKALAIGAILGAWASLMFLPLPNSRHRNNEQDVRGQQQKATAPALPSVERTVKADDGQYDPSNEPKKSSSWWQRVVRDPVASFTGLILLVYIGLFCVGWRQTNAIVNQLEAYERPWITVSIATDERDGGYFRGFNFWRNGSAVADLKPVIKNIGKSVATDVSLRVRVIAIPYATDAAFFTARLASLEHQREAETITLFPGEEHSWNEISRRISKADVDAVAFFVESEEDDTGEQIKYVRVACIGVAFYRFANSKRYHETQFAYLLERRGDYRSTRDAIPVGAGGVKEEHIRWVKMPGDRAT